MRRHIVREPRLERPPNSSGISHMIKWAMWDYACLYLSYLTTTNLIHPDIEGSGSAENDWNNIPKKFIIIE